MADTSVTPAHNRLLERHRANLNDYKRERDKIRANAHSERMHSQLLGAPQNNSSSGADYYIGERTRMEQSHQMVDQILKYRALTQPSHGLEARR